MGRREGPEHVRIQPVAAWSAPRTESLPPVDPRKNTRKSRLAPLELSPGCFTAFWLVLVGLHAASAAFLLASAQLYWFLEHPYLSYYADLLIPAEHRNFRLFGTLIGLLGAVNAVEFVGLLLASVRARRPSVPAVWLIGVVSNWIQKCNLQRRRSNPTIANTLYPRRQSSWMLERGLRLLSIESEQFSLMYTIREVIEVAAQVVQCYNYSLLIARPWINHAFVALVVVNCVATSILYHVLLRYEHIVSHFTGRRLALPPRLPLGPPLISTAFARLLCLLVDCVINFGTSIALPVAVFTPYILAYDADNYTFPLTLLYSDTAFPNLVRENQALFARSVWDATYKVVPHISTYASLLTMASLLRAGQATRPTRSIPTKTTRIKPATVQDDGYRSAASTTSAPPLVRQKRAKPTKGTSLKRLFVAVLFLSTAIVVLVLHVGAAFASSRYYKSSSSASMCMQPLLSWFASKFSCAVVEFNCHRHGVASPPENAFDHFDSVSVSGVLFMHCPALVMPQAIRSFNNLLGLEVYNSTLVEWGVDAALSDDTHPNLIFLVMVYVNMTELPPGVVQTSFPARLGDIELSKTNLTSLPAVLSQAWSNVDLVYIEHSGLTEVPRELLEIPLLSELSLIGNAITAVPSEFATSIQIDNFYSMALSMNPIESLPESLRTGLTFGFLSLELTNMAALPSWAAERVSEAIYAYGSPLCSADSASVDSMVEAACSQRDERGGGRYPLEIVAPLRQL